MTFYPPNAGGSIPDLTLYVAPDDSQLGLIWVGFWVASKAELASYPASFVGGSIPAFDKIPIRLQPRLLDWCDVVQ
jgi:hypothetical protein